MIGCANSRPTEGGGHKTFVKAKSIPSERMVYLNKVASSVAANRRKDDSAFCFSCARKYVKTDVQA